ncbi:MAG: hypothetical protein EBZ77_12800 [Chitinophagia bacterium]|nr:hypothetical protein [Chitinophagia bacterium]
MIAAASATAAVVMQMYADRANAEKEQCLARWETTYSSIIKDENGELLEIDSAEKWSENLVYIEHKIESHPEVNGDPEKANELLVEMLYFDRHLGHRRVPQRNLRGSRASDR